jgi:cytochrome c
VGPAYLDVAMRYRDDKEALTRLQQKLKTGGAGAWGEIPMPPQAAVNEQQSQQIIQAILGLSEGMSELRGKRQGTFVLPAAPANAAPGGAWEIVAQAPNTTNAKIRLNCK